VEGLTLAGRTAVVTGGAGGMGSAISRDLASLGARVVVADINADGAAKVAADLPDGLALPVDLADPESVAGFAAQVKEAVGRVDVLVNNAGWDKVEPFLKSTPQTWDRLIAINLRAPIQLTHAFLGDMVEARWGRLVFVASDAGRVGSSGEAVYAACKAGLIGFSKTIARESAKYGVSSNTVCPGPSDTPLLQEVAAGNPKLVESLERSIPMKRLAHPDDIAGVVAYFCTERAGYVTGQTISVSGGLTMV
jgi:2-hydroxycyclohexanecarboxyl-CoA dehydrogenase